MVRLVMQVSGGEFYDEYGDEIGEKEPGEVPTYSHVIGKPDLPGNNFIDLTDSDSSQANKFKFE